MPIPEHLSSNKKKLRRIESVPGADQPFIAVIIGHVVRWQKNRIVPRGIQMPVSSITDPRHWQDRATLTMKVRDHKLVMLPNLRFGCVLRTTLGPDDLTDRQQKYELFHSRNSSVSELCSQRFHRV